MLDVNSKGGGAAPRSARFDWVTRIGHGVSGVSSATGGLSVTLAWLRPDDLMHTAISAGAAGVSATACWGLGWYGVIKAASWVETMPQRVGVGIIAGFLTLSQILTTTHSAATMFGGPAAQQAALNEYLSQAQSASSDINTRLVREFEMIPEVRRVESQLRGLSECEKKGCISGTIGDSDLVLQLGDAADRAGRIASQMEAAKVSAERDLKRETDKLQELQFAASQNEELRFSTTAVAWHTVMTRLCNFLLTTLARTPVAIDFLIRNKGAAKVQSAIVKTTAGVLAKADAIDGERDPEFRVPMYQHKDKGDRIDENPGGAATHAWLMALALDGLSAVALALVMVMMWGRRSDNNDGGSPPTYYPVQPWPPLPPAYPQLPYHGPNGANPPPTPAE